MEDETGFGWARTIYLASTIGSLAILRIAGGLLLALAPLVAGLLLFDFARGLFAGWLRGLVLVALGSLGITILLAVEIAVMEPWLADALQRHGGSISAEHGIGLVKKPYLGSTRSAAEVALMRGIRQAFDPNGVMNPGKLFD